MLIAHAGANPRLKDVIDRFQKLEDRKDQQLEFLKKQALNIKKSIRGEEDQLWKELKEVLIAMKALPDFYNEKDYNLRIDRKKLTVEVQTNSEAEAQYAIQGIPEEIKGPLIKAMLGANGIFKAEVVTTGPKDE